MQASEGGCLDHEEFKAEGYLHLGKRNRVIDDEVNKEDKTICTSNVPNPNEEPAAPDKSICHGPLTFDPLPPIAAVEDAPFLPLITRQN